MIKCIVLGGYHNNRIIEVDDSVNIIDLVEDLPLNGTYNTKEPDLVTMHVHTYKRVNFKHKKDIVKVGWESGVWGGTYWQELNFNSVFVPITTPPQYIDTLREVFDLLLKQQYTLQQSILDC